MAANPLPDRRLLQGIGLSIAIHLLAMFALSGIPRFPSGNFSRVPLHARFATPRADAARLPGSAVKSAAPFSSLNGARTDLGRPRRPGRLTDGGKQKIAANPRGGSIAGGVEPPNVQTPGRQEMGVGEPAGALVGSEELRWYRLSLGRALREFRRYPAAAREQGWAGTVELTVSVSVVGATPVVAVFTSSGYPILDDEAVAMLTQAVRQVPLAGSLRGQAFRIRIPVQFMLTD